MCNECNQEKDFSEFLQRKDSKDGHRKNCKKCFYAKNEPKKKEYYLLNREKIKENSRNREKYRKETDVIFRLENQISSSIRMSLKNFGYKKNSRTYEILGCSYEEFRLHIESKFEDWMNWDNHGKYTGNYNETWQYDHIIPISSATTEEEILKLNHYTNFQPLCSKKNQIDKRNKINYNI